MVLQWTDDETEKLISSMHKYTVLWKTDDANYGNMQHRNEQAVGRTVQSRKISYVPNAVLLHLFQVYIILSLVGVIAAVTLFPGSINNTHC